MDDLGGANINLLVGMKNDQDGTDGGENLHTVRSSPLAANSLLALKARAHAQVGSILPSQQSLLPLPAVLPLAYEDLVAIVVGKLLAQTADAELVGHVRITHAARLNRNNFARNSNFH